MLLWPPPSSVSSGASQPTLHASNRHFVAQGAWMWEGGHFACLWAIGSEGSRATDLAVWTRTSICAWWSKDFLWTSAEQNREGRTVWSCVKIDRCGHRHFLGHWTFTLSVSAVGALPITLVAELRLQLRSFQGDRREGWHRLQMAMDNLAQVWIHSWLLWFLALTHRKMICKPTRKGFNWCWPHGRRRV